jgi:alpha-1,6-mannosyltransferase
VIKPVVRNQASQTPISAGILASIAIPLAVYLCIALTRLGIDKFYYIAAGGKRFATFPNDMSYWGVSVSYLALVLLHLVWVLGAPDRDRFLPFSVILRRCGVFLLLAWVAYPLGNDVYLYLHVGLMNLARVDPFLVPAGAFISEFTPFVDWKQTSTYGPVSQLLFLLAALLVRWHPLLAVYGLKLVCLLTHCVNGYWVWRMAPVMQRDRWAIAYLLCPLLLVEQVASAHVDVFVCTSALLMAACLFSQRYGTAVLAIWGGFLTKTIPIIWLPMLFAFLLRQRRWRQIGVGVLVSGTMVAVLGLLVLRTPEAWLSLLNPGVAGQYQSSLVAMVRALLETLPYFRADAAGPGDYRNGLLWLSRGLLLAYGVFYGLMLLRLLLKRISAERLLEDMGWVTLILMLYATSWLMPWYVSLPLAIAAALPTARIFGITVLLFSLSSAAMYWLQGDAGLRSLVAVGLPTLGLWGMAKWRMAKWATERKQNPAKG